MKRRIFSLLLALVMLLEVLPALPAAAESTPVYRAAYEENLTLDGDPLETAWITYYPLQTQTGAAVGGSVSFLWNRDGIGLSVRYTGAEQLRVQVGGKTLEVALTAGSAGQTAAVSATGNCAEVFLTWSECGISLLDFGQILSGIRVELVGSSGNAALEGDLQITSDYVSAPEHKSSGDYTKAWRIITSGISLSGNNTFNFDVSTTGVNRILRAKLSFVDHSQDMILSQDLYFDSLPVSDGKDSGNNQPSVNDSFFFYSSYGDGASNAKGPTLGFSVYKGQDSNLYLWNKANNTSVCLDRKEKQSFRLSVLWKTDGDCTVYVDGQEKGTFQGATFNNTVGLGVRALCYGYNLVTADASAKSTLSNVVVMAAGAETTLDGSVTTTDILKKTVGDTLVLTEDLPKTWEFSSQIGPVPLTWSSEPAGAVTADGQLIRGDSAQTVTLTASVGTVSLGSVEVTVAAADAAPVVEAIPVKEITLDGSLKDINWVSFLQLPAASQGKPSGIAGIAYNKNGIYIGTRYADAHTLTVTLAGKTVTADLVNGTVTGGTAAFASGAAELNLSWEQLGVQPTDYGFVIGGFRLTLSGAGGDTSLTERPADLKLTAREVHHQALNGYRNSNSSKVVATANSVVFNADAANVYYLLKTDNPAVDHSKDILLQQDIRIDTMPVVSQETAATITGYGSAKDVDCYYFWLSDGVAQQTGSARGPMTLAAVYRSSEAGDLRVRVATGDGGDFSLGKKLGDTFRLQMLWTVGGAVEVFVDGFLAGTVENATAANVAGAGIDTIQLRYANVTGAGKVAVSNVSITTALVESVLSEITAASVLAGIDTTCVQANMKLPASYTNQYLGAIPLTWVSSDPSVLGHDGRILNFTDTTVQLTCYVEQTALWTVDITILPLPEEPAGPAAASPAVLTAAFSASPILLDGFVDEEGWIMNGNVLDGDNLKKGEFGAQWREGILYMAVETREAETLVLTLNGKTVTVDPSALTASGDFTPTLAKAENDTVVELSVPFPDLGLVVEDYNVTVPVTVVLDGGSYRGSLKLMSVDWYATENKSHPLPVPLKGNSKYGLDAPTDHQGYEQINDGWRLFDLYNPQGENPTQVRSYVILTKNDLYNGWLTHDQTFHAEFDFLAKSLPVYDSSVIGWNESMACYGVPFFISDVADSGNRSNCVSMGIFNTADGLAFVVLTKGGGSETVLLEKTLGQQFRVGLSWRLGGTLVLYIDGEEFAVFQNAEENRYAFGNKGIGFNVVRSTQAATGSADDMDVYITNIALGKSYDDCLLDNLTFDDFKGENLSPEQVVSQLMLPETLSTPQLTTPQKLTWTTSDAGAIDASGNVFRPATGGRLVTLTATLPGGQSKQFHLVVLGQSNHSGNVLVAYNDLNPGTGVGSPVEIYPFTLDTGNNSVIIDLETVQKVNVAKLTDGDAFARLNEENLTLWVSNDNVTYTEIKHFRLLHRGESWYLYDFEAEARYVKVHCTHFDGAQADFIGEAATMLTAYHEDVFGAGSGTFTESSYTVTNSGSSDWKDKAITVPMTDLGIAGDGIRIYMNGSLLYHYVDGDQVIFRVDDLAAGESAQLRILSGNAGAMNIANKEFVYEVTYGAREASLTNARWLLTLADGTLLAMKSSAGKMSTTFSYDGGRTWSERTPVAATANWISGDGGGFLYNPEEPDRILFVGFHNQGFVSGDITRSNASTNFIISEDGGKTWRQLASVPRSEGDVYSNYMITYSPGTLLADHDGDGPNIDYVLPIAAQYNNMGSLCGRIAYSADNGLTWSLSESLIIYGAADNKEGGCSEMTIEQREDGTLVLLSRCENTESVNFAQAYSYDFGVTWENIKYSSVYTVNTQPMFYRYDGAPLLVWGGNNALGGEARVRAPMSVAVSHDGFETFANIQDLYAKYTFQGMTKSSMHRITNQSVTKGGEDTLLISWTDLHNRVYSTPTISVYDFTDYFYRTKGAYDSFEHGTVRYEGWEATAGSVTLSDAHASDGSYSMYMGTLSEATRSIPYLQDGRIVLDVYVEDLANFQLELQSAYTNLYGQCTPVGLQTENNGITFLGADSASGLTLHTGWNTIAFDLKLGGNEPSAVITVNGTSENMPVNGDIGNYICYITISADNGLYVDDVLVEDRENALVHMESPASIVMSKINAIGEVTMEDETQIKAARAAYDALTEEEKARVTNYEVLVAAEEALLNLLPGFGINLVLNETIDMNLIPKNGVALEGNVISLTYADGSTAEYTIATVNGSPAVRHSFNADQMSETVTIQIFDAQGTPLTKALTISVRDYVGKLLSVTQNDTEKALMIRLLDYGALAQIYGAREAGETVQAADLANSIITSDLRTFMNSYDMGTPESYNPNMVSTGGTFSANLTLNESVDLNVYVNPAKMLDSDKIVVMLGDKVLTEGQYKQGVTANGEIAIRYSFNADAMNEELTVALADETSGEVRISLSMSVRKLAYVSMTNYSSDSVLCATFAALLDYGALAQQYAGTNTDDLANRYVTADQRKLLNEYPWPAN